jgi:hypothetical protein
MMRIARNLGLLILAAMLGVILGGCWSGIYEKPAAQYVNRSDTISLGAGNSKDINAATHVIDPWPRNVNNKRIPGNGERMVGAVQRYQRPQTGRAAGQVQGRSGSTSGEGASAGPPAGASGSATPATLPF